MTQQIKELYDMPCNLTDANGEPFPVSFPELMLLLNTMRDWARTREHLSQKLA